MENPTRILAVDDSVTIRKALELILVPAGHHVQFAVNGADAVARAREMRPDIVLLDFILPDMRGTEVCRELLADPQTRDLPVVLISARGAEIQQAYNDIDNVVDYLAKPFTPDAVLRVIAEVLATRPVPGVAATGCSEPMGVPAATAGVRSAGADTPLEENEETSPRAEAPAASRPAPPPAIGVQGEPGASPASARPAARHEVEAMFETLCAGLEGVYVEEIDTPAGAGADRARSYTELASRLARQLGETLEQAESGQRFRLYGDGSIRSLDEALLDTYRRVCRLLFRAVAAGALGIEEADRQRQRLLIVCPRDSECHEALAALAGEPGEAHAFLVDSSFRQLPVLARLFGPTHLIVDFGRGPAIAQQIALVRSLSESRHAELLEIRGHEDLAGIDPPADAVFAAGPGLQEALRSHLRPEPSRTEIVEPPAARAAGA